MTEREAFESWVRQSGAFTDWTRFGDGYAKPLVDRTWQAWQAAVKWARAEPPDWTDRYTLPCDVRLPPATIVRKGCTMKTLIVGLIARENIGDAGADGEEAGTAKEE